MPSSGLIVSQMEGVTVATFRSSSLIDQTTVESLGKELHALVDEQARRKIVLDFGAVRFLSSQMLGSLIALHKKAQAIRGRVVLCGLREDLLKVFKITRLDKILEFAADEAEALKRFEVLGSA